MKPPPPLIFDRIARRLRRDRVALAGPSPLESGVADELLERLDAVMRPFESALVINTGARHLATALKERGITVTETDHGVVFAVAAAGIFADEDRLNVEQGEFDLVVFPSGLDTVDDVPGALIAARRALRPGGLFLACLIGSPSLPVLREVASSIDAAQGRAVARVHPQIDVRGAGDLLVRAGFALPVADAETLRLSYSSLDKLAEDVRAAGLTNVLVERYAMSKGWLAAARAAFEQAADGSGRVTETVTLLVLTGWASEAKPQG
jgi:NADH dehydrogenase [ubiquinone] 1 alpha subcomplex assembly factor 5